MRPRPAEGSKPRNTFEEMRARVEGYAKAPGAPGHQVGCIMVSQPVFFADGDWVEQPKDWKPNVVSGAGYDLTVGEGRRVWEKCTAKAARAVASLMVAEEGAVPLPMAADATRFGAEQLVRPPARAHSASP